MGQAIICTVLALILTTGCTKDPSLVAPTNQYSTSNYPASLDDLKAGRVVGRIVLQPARA